MTDRAERCPHGDETCPCQDGDACHYEGPDAMQCPTMDDEHRRYHCHVEGCSWDDGEGCGQAKLGRVWDLCRFADLRGTPEWMCGAARNLTSDPDPLSVLIKGPKPREMRRNIHDRQT
jgi:hypothetical protein